MTPEQVADLLQLDSETDYRLIRDGRLATLKIGRAGRVTRGALEAFLAADGTTPTLREALFRRVMAVAELERMDEEAKEQAHARRL